ncbi:MAG: hypothetical protein HYX51_00150 [Chloroflexi bacterium]|nr:hypothetical protein [Chloroflexota bacterium]
MTDHDAVHQRFVQAVYLLATSSGRIQERVSAAWLELMPLRRDDVPPELSDLFSAIEDDMLNAPDDLDTISDTIAAQAAERVLVMEFRLRALG